MARDWNRLPTERDYEQFFHRQVGKGPPIYPYYVGLPVQRGHGWPADVVNWIGRRIVPLYQQLRSFTRSQPGKKFGKSLIRRLANTGAAIVSDKFSDENGVPLKRATKRRFSEMGRELIGDLRTAVAERDAELAQGGSGPKRRRCLKGKGKRIKGRKARKRSNSKPLVVHWSTTSRKSRKRKKRYNDILEEPQ
jgi:hypothetical protein